MSDQEQYLVARKDAFLKIMDRMRDHFEHHRNRMPKQKDVNNIPMEKFIEHQTFQHGYNCILQVTAQLWQGAEFHEILPHISSRYHDKISLQDPVLQKDLKTSSKAMRNGIYSAIEDVMKITHIIDRDFDMNYTGPSQQTLADMAKEKNSTPEQVSADIQKIYREKMDMLLADIHDITSVMKQELDHVETQIKNSQKRTRFFKRGPKR